MGQFDFRPFGAIVIANPKVKLSKKQLIDFVPMDSIRPGTREVESCGQKNFTGGAKFESGDTLFARITPCLENGKIAQYRSGNNSPAAGSTEFWVFRGLPDVTDTDFVYYLCQTEFVRKPAEKSMSGASGRQRAILDSVLEAQVPLPPLPTQRKIAAILSAYDDLIENNARRVRVLEEMARALYREWFVEYRFPGHEQAEFVEDEQGRRPKEWEWVKVGDRVELLYGKALRADERKPGPYPVYGSGGVVGWHSLPLSEEPGVIVGRKGNVGAVYWSDEPLST